MLVIMTLVVSVYGENPGGSDADRLIGLSALACRRGVLLEACRRRAFFVYLRALPANDAHKLQRARTHVWRVRSLRDEAHELKVAQLRVAAHVKPVPRARRSCVRPSIRARVCVHACVRVRTSRRVTWPGEATAAAAQVWAVCAADPGRGVAWRGVAWRGVACISGVPVR